MCVYIYTYTYTYTHVICVHTSHTAGVHRVPAVEPPPLPPCRSSLFHNNVIITNVTMYHESYMMITYILGTSDDDMYIYINN